MRSQNCQRDLLQPLQSMLKIAALTSDYILTFIPTQNWLEVWEFRGSTYRGKLWRPPLCWKTTPCAFLFDLLVSQRKDFFFLRLPNGQYGPVSKMSQPKTRRCTGPFNWGGAHCAGEKSETQNRTIPTEVSTKTSKTKRARPATATRNPPARLPGARAKKQQHNTKETSTTDPGTP